MAVGIQMEGSMGKLAHKVTAVTGASTGIRAEIARDPAAVECPFQSIYVGRRNGPNARKSAIGDLGPVCPVSTRSGNSK